MVTTATPSGSVAIPLNWTRPCRSAGSSWPIAPKPSFWGWAWPRRVGLASGAPRRPHDEISETIAFLEDMPLRRAVKRLELARQDLANLSATLRRLLMLSESDANTRRRSSPQDLRGRPCWTSQRRDRAHERIARQVRELERLVRRVRGEWQEKLLSLRLENLLGPRLVKVLETAVLWLILILTRPDHRGSLLDRAGWLSDADRVAYSPGPTWRSARSCSVEFVLKLCTGPTQGSLFPPPPGDRFPGLAPLRIPFVPDRSGAPRIGPRAAADTLRLMRFLRLGRLIQMLRYVRALLPVVRLARLGLFLLRLSDRLVRRHAGLLNRNIVLFEPYHAQRPESSDHHRLAALRASRSTAAAQLQSRLDPAELPAARGTDPRRPGHPDRDAACRSLRRPRGSRRDTKDARSRSRAWWIGLIQLSPERLIDRMGPGFVTSADRYLRLLDVPLLRRLPVIRNLVAYRQKSPAEAVTLAANYLGHLIQRFLDMVYFLADLQGTLSPPVFLDRLGATIVSATRTPAKRLLWMGTAFLSLFLVVNSVTLFRPFRGFVDQLQNLLGWPVIVLGVICLGFWLLGSWFRKIANQSADFCERVVEAQFAAQTKNLKSRRREQDAQFLAERVIDPELLLRSSDDLCPRLHSRRGEAATDPSGRVLFENRELIFLRNVRLLYQDYLDGSPFHRSDTKASVQLLGNLALTNLRRSHLGHLLREGRALDRLDLNRAAGIFGGPHLWFNYITRMIVQETAILLLDYNRHAIPLDRLACSSAASREFPALAGPAIARSSPRRSGCPIP